VKNREQEGSRFPTAGLRAGQQVAAGKRRWYRVTLNRGGAREAELAESPDEVGM
jgi:hypothetical protein